MSLTAGVVSLVAIAQGEVDLSATAASGGTGPYTEQWYRSTVSGFTPGAGTLLAGATALTLNDSTVTPGTLYYYKVVYTDTGAGNATVTSTQFAVTSMGAQSPNQFAMSSQVGMVDLLTEPGTVAAVVADTQATALYAGMPVKLVDDTSPVPKVVGLTADTDEVFGFINYNVKNRSFVAGDAVTLSQAGNVIYLYASSAIARGAQVCVTTIAQASVGALVTGKNIVGWAADKAPAQGALIRVKLTTPSYAFAP